MTQPPALPPELDPRRRATAAAAGKAYGANGPVPAAGGGAGSAGGGTLYGGGSSGSGSSGGGSGSPARKALTWAVCAISLIVLLGSGGAYGYVRYVNSTINRINVFCVGSNCYKRPAEKGGTENFLLVGSDTRAGDNSTGSLSGLANGTSGNGLSDTTMLIHLDADGSKVQVLSFPRDMLVTRPSYTTKSGTVVPAAPAKFNAAFSVGGAPLLVKQIEQLSGLRVDHFVEVDFAGFVSIVNALGGVDVCLKSVDGGSNLRDPGIPGVTGGSGFKGHVGVNKLIGDNALAFVRQRDGLPGGDLDRIARQHLFLAAILHKIQTAGVLLNPIKLNGVITSLAKDVTTDTGTSTSDLLTLGTRFKNVGSNQVEFYTVPTNGGESVSGLGDVLIANQAGATALYQDIANDIDPSHPTAPKAKASTKAPAAAPATKEPPLTVAPASISVGVENGSGISGQATTAAKDLRARGFQVVSVTNSQKIGQNETIVRYGSNRAESARTVAAAIAGSQLEADSSLSADSIVVVTGSQFSGTQAVTVGGSASTTAPSTTGSAAAPTSAAPSATPAQSTGSSAVSGCNGV